MTAVAEISQYPSVAAGGACGGVADLACGRAAIYPLAIAYSLAKATTEQSSGLTWSSESRRGWEGGVPERAKTLLSAGNNGCSVAQ